MSITNSRSVQSDNLVRVQLTEDTRSERACLPALPSSLDYVLMLIDAGYFELELFAAIDDREGSFLCKAPQSINPLILAATREDGTHLFGNVISALMNHGASLISDTTALLSFWEINAKREHPARDGRSGRTRLDLYSLGGA